jgi:hypothetical protein
MRWVVLLSLGKSSTGITNDSLLTLFNRKKEQGKEERTERMVLGRRSNECF